jgi:beta-glucosidase
MKSPKIRMCLLMALVCLNFQAFTQTKATAHKIDSLLKVMTLEEKAGQLNQAFRDLDINPASKEKYVLENEIRHGRVSSVINANTLEEKIRLQKIAVNETRLHIPLLFAADVIHGYKTIFPIPLAQAASWDLTAIEQAERIAATEAASAGVHWTFAPMVDVSRDPRWGRVSEGAGEDTYLAALIGKARVKGFQGSKLGDVNTVMACAKHFIGYGAVEAGREYNTTDMSEVVMRNYYLAPFKQCVDAGVATVMNAFTTINQVPASANQLLVKQILKKEMSFSGFTVSDANSFGEIIDWGYAANGYDAAYKCMKAGSDMDMNSFVYMNNLPRLVRDGKIKESELNDAVRRVLQLKFKMGLFDDPFKFMDKQREKNTLMKPAYLEASLDLARKSMVLLRNSEALLPLKKNTKSIAFIGPLTDSHYDNDYIGTWSAQGSSDNIVTVLDAVKKKLDPSSTLLYAPACEGYGHGTDSMLNAALEVAKRSDIVVLCLGESGYMSNENASRVNLELLPRHQQLLKKVKEMGKPMVLVLFTGRPLILNWESENIPSILLAWRPGTMGGQAIADVLFGDYNPSGKLPMSFPRHVGQVPVYYNHLNTGRPGMTSYSDIPNTPLYPFGYGLSYTTYQYSDITLSRNTMGMADTLKASVEVKNTGIYAGEEIVQLYIRDLVADVARPVKELKGFKKIKLAPGESAKVEFPVTTADLAYWNDKLQFKADPGEFNLFIGTSSDNCLEAGFILK